MKENYISIGNFVEQIKRQLKNTDDTIESIGTWSGNDKQIYTIHCKSVNGEKYDINISKEV